MAAYTGWRFEVAWDGVSYQDMTSRVRGAVTIVRGRAQELTEVQPGTMTAVLDNVDKELTALNPVSALHPNVKLGRRGRLVETVGAIDYVRFTGRITDMDPGEWVDSGDAVVTFTFTDRLDELQHSEQFISTLAGHVLGSVRNDALKVYWPLNDPGSHIADVMGTLPGEVIVNRASGGGTVDPVEILYRDAIVAPADDLETIFMLDGTVTASHYPEITGIAADGLIPVASDEVVTVVGWIRPDLSEPDVLVNNWLSASVSGVGVTVYLDPPASTGELFIESIGLITGTESYGPVGEKPYIVGFQLDPAGGTLVWWVDDQVITPSMAGTQATPLDIGSLRVRPDGHSAHIQLYVGDPADFTHDDFLAQRQVGLYGLERQSPGERLTSLAGYAGLTSGEYDIDGGSGVLKRAALAGQTQYDAMSEAFTLDNGDLFVAGDDRLKFRDRAYRYNQPAAATLQHRWLDDGLQSRVDGPIINLMDVDTGGGPSARSRDAESIADLQKVHPAQLTVQTDQPDEPANAARWRTLQYSIQRQRVPFLPIDLLHHAEAGRDYVLHAVLGLDIADRADLAGMDPTYPAGADKLIIEGYTEQIGEKIRRIEFVTSPVLGTPAGTAGRWFKLDDPDLGQLDAAGHPLAY